MRVLEQETPANDPSPKLAKVMVRIAVCGARRGNSCRQLRVTQGDNGDSDARKGVRNYLRKLRKVYADLVKSCMESQTKKRKKRKGQKIHTC